MKIKWPWYLPDIAILNINAKNYYDNRETLVFCILIGTFTITEYTDGSF